MSNKTQTIIITVGLPASGKSTATDKFIKENPTYIKVERDELRKAFQNIEFGDRKFEDFITDIQYKAIHSALNNKYNVIISDTNCNIKYLKPLVEEFKYKANIIFNVFKTDLETCIERDSKRDRKVGEPVIRRMYENLIALRESGFLQEYKKEHYTEQYIPMNAFLPNCIIVDLDGTLCHTDGNRGIYDWKKVGVDRMDFHIGALLDSYSFDDRRADIMFLTGRSEECRKETEIWLKKRAFKGYKLIMRESNDFRKSTVVKKELYEKHIKGKYNVLFALEDKTDICQMWRAEGIKTLQVVNDK